MTGPAARLRVRWKYLAIASGMIAVMVGIALWYATTESFQSYVRRRMVAEVERITGGRAEIGSFHIVPFHLQVEVRNITVHGTEAAGDVPLVHADSLVAHVKIISFLRTEFGFYSVILDHPVVHIEMAADGSTNIPGRSPAGLAARVPTEQLFALSIDHLTLKNGELLWADRKIPLDFSVHDAASQMDYSYLHGRYESHLSLGKVDTQLLDFRPFEWSAALDFSLGTDKIDLKSLEWKSGRSSLQASGGISDFLHPHLEGTYDARVDLAEAGTIARFAQVREGIAEFKGKGQWALDDFSASGAVALSDIGWQDDLVMVKKANVTADYSVTDQQIKLWKVQGKILGGSVAGEAQVDNWLNSVPIPPGSKNKNPRPDFPVISAARPIAKKGEKAKLVGVQSGVVRLRFRDVAAGDLALALDRPSRKFDHFHPAGSASGNVDVLWRGAYRDAEVGFGIDVSPSPSPRAGEMPVTAHIQGKYQGASDALALAQFSLSTPASRIQASGVLAAPSTLHVSLSTTNLDEWMPLVTAMGGPAKLPFRVDGSASFNGVIGGTFSSPTLAGALAAQDFEFTVPATSRTPEQEVQWDSLAANIQLSSHDLVIHGGSVRRGATSADFDISAVLQDGHFSDSSPYTAHASLRQVDVASTAALAGFDYPVAGTADVSLQVSGTRAHPKAQGHIHASNASVYGEAIEKFDADLHIAAGEHELNNISLTHEGATVFGRAAFAADAKTFHLDLSGKNFDLGGIHQIHVDHLPIEGRADFTLQGSGTIEAPEITAGVHVRNLTLDRELEGSLDLQAVTKGGEMRVTGRSEFLKGILALDGTIAMHGDFPANISVRTDHVDLDGLWRAYLGDQLTGHSSVGGVVTMNGPLRYPKQWTLNGSVSDLVLDVEYAKLHNQDPVRFSYSEQTAHIERSHFVGDGTDIVGSGSIHFAGRKELDIAADGQLDLKLLGSFIPNLTASGGTTIHLTLGGTLSAPQPQGSVEIQNASANYAGLPSGLSEMNGSLSFTRDRVHINQLAARTGGGTLDLKGDATNFGGQLNFNLTAVGKDVRLRYPPGVSSTATAEVHWVGNRSSSTVSGDVMVTKLAVTPGFDFGSYLEQTRQSAGITAANSPLYNVKLDLAVRTSPELQMKTATARLSGDADLRLRGSVARPSVLGRADILEGDATFNGIRFRLERGDITFANPVSIEPQVNLQATTHVRNYDLDVTVTGTPDRLNVNYRSEPPLPKSDIIALLALGRTSEESEQLQQQSGQGVFTDEATNLIINQAINSTVSSRMQKLFGVSRIKIDPQGLSTETNPTARGPQVTIEQQFANNLTLTYSTNVSQSSEQIIQGEYFINRNMSIVGNRDQNGVVSFDIRVRRQRK